MTRRFAATGSSLVLVGALLLAGCGKDPIKRHVFDYDLVSDGSSGARRNNAAYIPSDARHKLREVVSGKRIKDVPVPRQTPEAISRTRGRVSVTTSGSVRVVWKGAGRGELEFQSIPDGDVADGRAFDGLVGVCERAVDAPPRGKIKAQRVPVEADPKPGCLSDYGDLGMSLVWTFQGSRFAVRDNRPERSMPGVLAIAKAPKVNLLAS